MKKYGIRIVVLVILLSMTGIPTGHADLIDKEYTWSDKLGRGALNVISSPVEVARTINVTSKTEGAGYGWTMGLVQGLGRMLIRFGSGAVEIVTCPFDFPKEDKTPLIEPEYVWQKWDGDYAKDSPLT